MHCTTYRLAVAIALALALPSAHAADVSVQPSAGSGFVVKDATGTQERLRVQETGAISLPGIASAPAQPQSLCAGTGGQLGPCSSSAGSSYTSGTGLALAGTTFSVAPTYQLPQGCAANQIAQWNGSAWACGAAGGGAMLPAGTVNQTLRYDAGNVLVANNLLQAFGDGALLAGGVEGTGNIPATGNGTRMMWYPAKSAFRAGTAVAAEWDAANVGLGSVAMGVDTMAKGDFSTALGTQTIAEGSSSTAMGYLSKAGYGSTAIGFSNTAAGAYSTALGVSTQANGSSSTAMGSVAHANGRQSTAMGDQTVADANDSTAMGHGTKAQGDTSTAMGLSTIADGPNSTAMGQATYAHGENSIAMGLSTIASGANSTAMGVTTVASADGSTAMGTRVTTKDKTGSFVYGDTQHSGTPGSVKNDSFNVFAYGGINFYTHEDFASTDPNAPYFGVGIPPGGGSWVNISDRNQKTAVRPVDAHDVLKKVAALPMNTWQYKAEDAKYRHMGPMAQDFFAAFQLGESDKGIATIDAEGVALAAIQGLHAELAEKHREMTMQLKDKDAEIAALRAESAEQTKTHDAQIATLRNEKDLEVAALRAELSTQKAHVAALESLAGEIVEMKAQLAALRRSPPAAVSVALEP